MPSDMLHMLTLRSVLYVVCLPLAYAATLSRFVAGSCAPATRGERCLAVCHQSVTVRHILACAFFVHGHHVHAIVHSVLRAFAVLLA